MAAMSHNLSVPKTLGAFGLAAVLLVALTLLLPAAPVQAQPIRPPNSVEPDPADLEYLSGIGGPSEAIIGQWKLLRPQIITYTIQPGDNDWSIARRFGLDIDTLRFSNEWMRRNPDLIHPGKELVILPLPGAYHTVAAGDTLPSIAQRYGVSQADIVQFPLNKVNATGLLSPGQKLVIPHGRLDYADRILAPGPASGYALAWPMRGTLTQGYRAGHLAIDIGSYYGAKVYASRGGRVTYARFSPDGWLGFRVIIVHDNGLQTSYSHLSGIFVEQGETVARGQVIGQLGSTGNSTGPHVHFEVWQDKAKVNPLGLMPASPDR
jgi:LysM repeat protein